MKSMEQELQNLQERVARLEAKMNRISETVVQYQVEPKPVPQTEEEWNTEVLLNWMKAEGMIVELPPEAKKTAKKWETMPITEKQSHIDYMNQLSLAPPLSEMIIANRE
ncbi:MAG: hypothetical protein Fur0022_05110 [Anaerolineales bacterium]